MGAHMRRCAVPAAGSRRIAQAIARCSRAPRLRDLRSRDVVDLGHNERQMEPRRTSRNCRLSASAIIASWKAAFSARSSSARRRRLSKNGLKHVYVGDIHDPAARRRVDLRSALHRPRLRQFLDKAAVVLYLFTYPLSSRRRPSVRFRRSRSACRRLRPIDRGATCGAPGEAGKS
jgi:hypothetical protein